MAATAGNRDKASSLALGPSDRYRCIPVAQCAESLSLLNVSYWASNLQQRISALSREKTETALGFNPQVELGNGAKKTMDRQLVAPAV